MLRPHESCDDSVDLCVLAHVWLAGRLRFQTFGACCRRSSGAKERTLGYHASADREFNPPPGLGRRQWSNQRLPLPAQRAEWVGGRHPTDAKYPVGFQAARRLSCRLLAPDAPPLRAGPLSFPGSKELTGGSNAVPLGLRSPRGPSCRRPVRKRSGHCFYPEAHLDRPDRFR
jgi:hypothetical protein